MRVAVLDDYHRVLEKDPAIERLRLRGLRDQHRQNDQCKPSHHTPLRNSRSLSA